MKNSHTALAVLTTLSLLSARPVLADQVPSASLIIPEGTEVHVSLLENLKSGSNKTGEEIAFKVAQPVYGPNGVLLIPAAAPAYGKIVQSSRRGIFGKAGKIKFTIDYIVASDNTHIPLRPNSQLQRGRDNRGVVTATVILLDAVGLFINGRDATVKKGQDFALYVDADTVMKSPTPSLAAAPITEITLSL